MLSFILSFVLLYILVEEEARVVGGEFLGDLPCFGESMLEVRVGGGSETSSSSPRNVLTVSTKIRHSTINSRIMYLF